ncbi:hypothetical protein [Saccharothrix hoggarensis]|uniref:Uncharacterized protein n=1 Tax=Saccharothrix hoggarensis TaxID=913853 RepID=A0ABW3R301_9PSEU
MSDDGSARSSRQTWTDEDGVVWTRGRPRVLTERDARRLVLRASTLVVVERSVDDLVVLDPAVRREFWASHVAGHVDERTGEPVPPNHLGLTYAASPWTDGSGRRLVLLAEEC